MSFSTTNVSQLCKIREGFLTEWRRDYPCVPAPMCLPQLEQVCETTDVIDESQVAGHVATVLASLNAVHNKITQLKEQVQRKIRQRDFFIDVLFEFDKNESERWISHQQGEQRKSIPSCVLDVNKSWPKNAVTVTGPCCDCRFCCCCSTPPPSNTNTQEGAFRGERGVLSSCDAPVDSLPVSSQHTKLDLLRLSTTTNRASRITRQIGSISTSTSETEHDDRSISKVSPSISLHSNNNTAVVDKGIQCDLEINDRSSLILSKSRSRYNSSSTKADYYCASDEEIRYYDVDSETSSRSRSKTIIKVKSLENLDLDVDEDGSYFLKDEEGSYDNVHNTNNNNNNSDNITVIDCRGDMFRFKKGGGLKEGGGSKTSGDVSGCNSARRGSKDNFMAVTSKRKVSREEPSQSMRLKNNSPTNSPHLARNFQLLKLTRGFDLVLDNENQIGNSAAVKDRDGDGDTLSCNSVETVTDSSKNSQNVRTAPPIHEHITSSQPTLKIREQVVSKESSVNDILCTRDSAKCEQQSDSNTDQPDLIQSVQIDPRSGNDDRCRSSVHEENQDSPKPVMDTKVKNVAPIPPKRRSSKGNTPPPVPAKPRNASLRKAVSPTSSTSSISPIMKSKVTEADGRSEYSDRDILEALSRDGKSNSPVTASQISLSSSSEKLNKVSSQNVSYSISITRNNDDCDDVTENVGNHAKQQNSLESRLRRDSDSISPRRSNSPRPMPSPTLLSSSPSMALDIKSMLSTTTTVPVPQIVDAMQEPETDKSRNSTFYVEIDSSYTSPKGCSDIDNTINTNNTHRSDNIAFSPADDVSSSSSSSSTTTTTTTITTERTNQMVSRGDPNPTANITILNGDRSSRSPQQLQRHDQTKANRLESESDGESRVFHVPSDSEKRVSSNVNNGLAHQEAQHISIANNTVERETDTETCSDEKETNNDLKSLARGFTKPGNTDDYYYNTCEEDDSKRCSIELRNLRKVSDDFDCKRTHSSQSSDTSVETLVCGKDDTPLRSISCISDADVRAAISAFDQVVISAETESSSSPDSDNDGIRMHSTRKRRSSTPNYVNWTINRALTTSIHSQMSQDVESVSDDVTTEEDSVLTNDEDSCGGCSSVSLPSPQFHRQIPKFYHGSKDSGLCDDISVTDSMHSELDMGRITDLRQIQEMARCEEEEEKEAEAARKEIEERQEEGMDLNADEKDYDNVSVTSDIVFLPTTSCDNSSRDHILLKEHGDEGEDDNDINDFDQEQKSEARQESKTDSASLTSSLEDEIETECGNMSYDEIDSGRDGMLKMRQLLVKGVLESEKSFLFTLNLLIKYKNLLQASSQSSQAVINMEDIVAIFCNIESVDNIHQTFVSALEPKVANWTHDEQIGGIFEILVRNFDTFVEYANNYSTAVTAIRRCGQDNDLFHEVAEQIVVNSSKEVSSLEDALFKPVQRVQRNTLVLHDLIKCTPADHPDYEALQKALKLSQHNLENYKTAVPPVSFGHENKRLVKNSFLVELVNGSRKLRYVFLFSDILVCTKRETHRNKKASFVIKWFAHLAATSFDTKFEYEDDKKYSNSEIIEKLKSNIREVKNELKTETRKFDIKDKHRSLVSLGGGSGGTRAMEKLKKKLNQYEGELILSLPKLPFKISLEGGKEYTMLMTTDYEREEWKEALQFLCRKCTKRDHPVSSISVQDLINSVKETPQVNKIGNALLQTDEDALMGTLNVNIHTMNGLTKECDTYCCLEMDSFGHFFMMAKTRVCEASRDPIWNEDFEMELDGSQTLRILCFKKGAKDDGDVLLGRGALEFSRQWLRGSFQERTISMNEISLVISVRHTPSDKTMQRTPSRVINACFGVKISSSARREGKPVPTIVTACIQEVEKRGLDELGIYRVSGVTSDLQRMKKIFDKNVRSGAESLKEVDIHAVTGLLKMYLRELPEPLFTEALYQTFLDTLRLSDEEAKSQCLLSLYHSLPDTNYYTSVCILEHLVNVARNVATNKMSINNLATIFGPTLLAPAVKETPADPLEMMFKGTEQVMHQASFINYILGLAVSGRSLRKSAQ